jgi:hypothetical protein
VPIQLDQEVEKLVLQPQDLPVGFDQLPGTSTGADPSRGLMASFHYVYERLVPLEAAGDSTVAVFSFSGLYRDDASASQQIDNLDPDQLGREAGVPDMIGGYVFTRKVGDSSIGVHLTGSEAGVRVGVYIVAFTRGSVEGIVGVAATEGSESLEQALQLAEAQDARIQQVLAGG